MALSLFRKLSNRPLLSDRQIKKMNQQGLLIETELDPEQIQPNSVDLRLGTSVKIPKWNHLHTESGNFTNVIDPRQRLDYQEESFRDASAWGSPKHKMFILESNRFVLMASKDVLNIPNGYVAFVQGRSSIARIGIQTEQAGLIDSGFRGTITFEIVNQASCPIMLFEDMRVAQVYFFKAQYADKIYGIAKRSKYYLQHKATESRIFMDSEWRKNE